MQTILVVGKLKVKCSLTRDFKAGDAFSFNGSPHVVEAVQLETTHRLVRLVEAQEAQNESTSNRVPHRRRRSRKAFEGAQD